MWVSKKARQPFEVLVQFALKHGLLAFSLGCAEEARQAELPCSFGGLQRTDGHTGDCALHRESLPACPRNVGTAGGIVPRSFSGVGLP